MNFLIISTLMSNSIEIFKTLLRLKTMFDIFSLNSFYVRIFNIQIYLNFRYTSVYQNLRVARVLVLFLFCEVGSRFQHKCQLEDD